MSEQGARQSENATLEWERAVIAAVIDYLVMMPVGQRRRKFDVEAMRPAWRF